MRLLRLYVPPMKLKAVVWCGYPISSLNVLKDVWFRFEGVVKTLLGMVVSDSNKLLDKANRWSRLPPLFRVYCCSATIEWSRAFHQASKKYKMKSRTKHGLEIENDIVLGTQLPSDLAQSFAGMPEQHCATAPAPSC